MPSQSVKLVHPPSVTRIMTGQTSFEGGVDGGRIPLLATQESPNGLKYNQLAWLVNGTCRGGGISPRWGWKPILYDFEGDDQLFQGIAYYQPDQGYPYLIQASGGHVYALHVEIGNTVIRLTDAHTQLSSTATKFWFCQAENYLIIQDGINIPRVWDGGTMWIINEYPGADPNPNKMIQTGTAMDYYMGRVWVAQNREYVAGDIVGSTPSGTIAPTFRDAVLHMTENTWLLGGGKFTVPTVAGEIRAMSHTANLDTSLGEGQLFVFTRNTIYSVNVPATRADWASLSQPLQRIAQLRYGGVSDRSLVQVNGDLFYQAYDGIRSLMLAIRYYSQWAQTSMSHNMNRILRFNDRALLRFSSGMEFDNRLLQTALPFQTPLGVAHKAIIALDFDLITSLNDRLPPVWESHLEGIDVMQMVEGDWGGLQRGFFVAHSRITGKLQLWEMQVDVLRDNLDDRIPMVIDSPSYHWDLMSQLKQLDNGEILIDRIRGTVDFKISYRPDNYACYIPWYEWAECSARTTCEDVNNPICYPESGSYCEADRISIVLPKAPASVCDTGNGRPSDVGYSFQIRLEVKGECRVRGILLWAIPRDRAPYHNVRNDL